MLRILVWLANPAPDLGLPVVQGEVASCYVPNVRANLVHIVVAPRWTTTPCVWSVNAVGVPA